MDNVQKINQKGSIQIVIKIQCKVQTYNFVEWHLLGCYAVVALVRTDVSEELTTSFIRVTRIGELGTTQALTSN
jgi:hypothetical protein